MGRFTLKRIITWIINKTLIVLSTFGFGVLVSKTKILEATNVVQWQCSGCNEPTLLIQELRDMACD